jgi:uncharacterized protein
MLLKAIRTFALIAMISPFSLAAQESHPRKPVIDVIGTSETEVVPDEIYLHITLAERNEGREKLGIAKQEEDLKRHVKELGLDPGSLVLVSADADYRRKNMISKDVMVTKAYQLKIGSAEMLKKVYERLDEMNAHDAYISKVDHSRMKELRKENRIKAVKAAREKAEYLLGALGKQVGDPLHVSESGSTVNPALRKARYEMNAMATYANERFLDESEPQPEISFRKITIRSTVHITFEIR